MMLSTQRLYNDIAACLADASSLCRSLATLAFVDSGEDDPNLILRYNTESDALQRAVQETQGMQE